MGFFCYIKQYYKPFQQWDTQASGNFEIVFFNKVEASWLMITLAVLGVIELCRNPELKKANIGSWL